MHAVWQVARGWAAPCPPPRRLLQTKGECAEGAQGCVQNVHSSFVLASLLVCVLSRIFTACESVCLAARVCPGCSQLSYARLPQRLCAPRVFTARVCPGCWQPVCPPGSQLKCVEMVHSSCAYLPRSSRASRAFACVRSALCTSVDSPLSCCRLCSTYAQACIHTSYEHMHTDALCCAQFAAQAPLF